MRDRCGLCQHGETISAVWRCSKSQDLRTPVNPDEVKTMKWQVADKIPLHNKQRTTVFFFFFRAWKEPRLSTSYSSSQGWPQKINPKLHLVPGFLSYFQKKDYSLGKCYYSWGCCRATFSNSRTPTIASIVYKGWLQPTESSHSYEKFNSLIVSFISLCSLIFFCVSKGHKRFYTNGNTGFIDKRPGILFPFCYLLHVASSKLV